MEIELKQNDLIFTFGFPKSGTSFLQQIIDSHPQCICTSEQDFSILAMGIQDLINKYNAHCKNLDNSTVKMGYHGLDRSDIVKTIRDLIISILVKKYNQKTHKFATNDNSFYKFIEFYHELFPYSKWLHIVRHPCSVALSSWHNNIRMDPAWAQNKTLITWSKEITEYWSTQISCYENFSKQHNVFTIRYEDLVRGNLDAFKSLFTYLDVDASDSVIQSVMDSTNFDKKKETGNPYFREGQSTSWKSELPDEAITYICNHLNTWIDKFGFERA